MRATYDFNDDIPKSGLVIKYRDNLDRETAEAIKFGLLHFVTDITLFASEKFALEDFFKSVCAPYTLYTVFISLMMLVLCFFMAAVSYGQKIRDLGREQGVLRAIGLDIGQSNRIFLYEAFSVVSTACIAGIVVGLFATWMTASLFSVMTELPRTSVIMWNHILFLIVVISIATYLAVRIAASKLNKS